jgi:hydroxymethylpyrimidine/phosphomethylpyrimidine kinase
VTPIALTIAGSDSGGGAGIQADLKTFSALGVYGCSVITALTAQNTRAVAAIHDVPPDFLRAQIDTVFEDIRIDAVKIGMLGRPEVIVAVAEGLRRWRPRWIVLDPVMVAKSGDALLREEAVSALREELLPLADLITPNLPEAAVLLGEEPVRERAAMGRVAARLQGLGARNVLLKGGHLGGPTSPDLLLFGGELHWLEGRRVDTRNTHGTGCTLSSAIAAYLARGRPLPEAVARAKAWLTEALAAADSLGVGHGHGPVHHFHALWPHLERIEREAGR